MIYPQLRIAFPTEGIESGNRYQRKADHRSACKEAFQVFFYEFCVMMLGNVKNKAIILPFEVAPFTS